ncbi:MAG: DUF4981 domain-containing protein [Acidobacteriota bacterium]|nr:MAG: DUF4981 domain-containing protein [Acidobacteriota bacterium]
MAIRRLVHKRKATVLLALFSIAVAAGQERDWENPEIFERNQTKPHSTLMPFDSVEQALSTERKKSRWCFLLNGVWKFKWLQVPSEVPSDFFSPSFPVDQWDEIKVPGNWQMQGFGHPLFRNVQQTFPSNPPLVPESYNPVGLYRRTFRLPKGWNGRQIFLHFEGVKSASYVWVNGQEVGYNQGGMEPAEYDVTQYLREGKNDIAVQVIRYSDGTYLEDQDMWRLSGIYRDVYLMATPPVHMRDFYIRTDLDSRYVDATVDVGVELSNFGDGPQDSRVRFQLLDENQRLVKKVEGEPVSLSPGQTEWVALSVPVENPRKWSAEYPNLYTGSLELIDSAGKVIEAYVNPVGFREIEIRHQEILVNGVPIKFNGVNSHVHHPVTGRTMDRDTMRQDLVLMKRFNVNCVRTSHYPPNVEYLELADQLGIYVVDETGDEAHSTIYLSERPEWRAQYVDRARKMVFRDRNHPSVIIWSAGNESGSGENIAALIEEGKRIDPTRPAWLYGGNTDLLPFEDIVGPRYPAPDELEKVGQVSEDQDPRPSFMDEYLAATGNSLGHLEEYWELIRRYPRLTGGAIWDWISPGITQKVVYTPDESPRRNDAVLLNRAHLVEGAEGRAVDLSGHDDWVDLYDDPALDITGDQLSLAISVFPRRWNGYSPLITKGEHQYGLWQSDEETLEFFIHDGERIPVSWKITGDWEERWHRILGTYNGSELRLFVDGELVATRLHQGRIDHSPWPLMIGRSSELIGMEHPGELCNAIVDSVRVFAQALEPADITEGARKEALLWLDFEEVREEGEFFSLGIGARDYGLVWPDRRIQPELWQLKKTPQPVAVSPVDLNAGRVSIKNLHHFKNLSDYRIWFALQVGGKEVQSGSLDLDLDPGRETVVELPISLPVSQPGVEQFLFISFRLPEATDWAHAGHEVAWVQFRLTVDAESASATASRETDGGALKVKETDREIRIVGDEFEYRIDRELGTLTSMVFDGMEFLETGPRLNVWRAPIWNEHERDWGGRPIVEQWWRSGLDRLQVEVLETSVIETQRDRVRVRTRLREAAPENDASVLSSYDYIFRGDGEVKFVHRVETRGPMPEWLPKIGTQLRLTGSFEKVEWFGRGPHETYPDRKTGAKVGRYALAVDEFYEPYLVPGDYGNRTDVRWVSVVSKKGKGLLVTGPEWFNFSVHRFGTDNLSRASYPFQLRWRDGVTLNLDHAVTGVGGTPIRTLKKYRVLPGEYEYSIRLRPFDREERDPLELIRELASIE